MILITLNILKRGIQISFLFNIHPKINRHRFKLTKHAKLGITRSHVVAGAFASLNEVDVTELYGVMNALMKRGPSASPPSSPAAASYNSYYDNSSSQYL